MQPMRVAAMRSNIAPQPRQCPTHLLHHYVEGSRFGHSPEAERHIDGAARRYDFRGEAAGSKIKMLPGPAMHENNDRTPLGALACPRE